MSNAPPNYSYQQDTRGSSNSSYATAQSSLHSASSRSAPSSAYGSGAAPPVPQLTTNFNQQYENTPRPTTMHSSHSYSRSSPAVGLEQKYIPFSNTPDANRYQNAPSSKSYIPQTPTGAPSHSPLALADIRPRTELHMGDELTSPPGQVYNGPGLTQTTNSYLAPWAIYAYDWCNWPVIGDTGIGKMAICSYLEDPHNFIQILDTDVESTDSATPNLEFRRLAEATCSYPVTRILWEPTSSQKQTTDLLATSGDHLRLWSLPSSSATSVSSSIHRPVSGSRKAAPPIQKLTPLALLSNSKTPEHTAPITSLDWNQVSPKLIITSSIDTTCTIWDIPTLTAKTQLIAHDKEVFDVRFCAGSVDTFVSCGADGSVRMFDLRSLEHSTIIYEPSEKTDKGMLDAATSSPHDSHLLATFAQDSNVIRILDHRQPGQALLELQGHSSSINCIEWSPSRRGMLASGGDDSMVLYWDLMNPQNGAHVPTAAGINGVSGTTSPYRPSTSESGAQGAAPNVKGPAASWRCDYEVANVSWSPPLGSQMSSQAGDWLGVTGGRAVWGVKL
ncbi:MAG: hypothetical protein M1828_001394 [Chrysothrix sp. TS-e1954]|nr:MAG: hypothetical protein M1828_001394 [Chrysothrix sp. TS-e1954]